MSCSGHRHPSPLRFPWKSSFYRIQFVNFQPHFCPDTNIIFLFYGLLSFIMAPWMSTAFISEVKASVSSAFLLLDYFMWYTSALIFVFLWSVSQLRFFFLSANVYVPFLKENGSKENNYDLILFLRLGKQLHCIQWNTEVQSPFRLTLSPTLCKSWNTIQRKSVA